MDLGEPLDIEFFGSLLYVSRRPEIIELDLLQYKVLVLGRGEEGSGLCRDGLVRNSELQCAYRHRVEGICGRIEAKSVLSPGPSHPLPIEKPRPGLGL